MNRSTKRIFVALVFVAGMGGAANANDNDKPDAWVTMKTKVALLTTADVSATSINVDTVNGTVILHGKVESADEKNRAADVAKSIDGAREVRNLLQVVPDAKKPTMDVRDDEIKQRVEAALSKDIDLKSSQITVQSVNNGVVLIGGKASSLSDHLLAVQDAHRVPGVRRVASEVEGPSRLTDRELWNEIDTDAAHAKDDSKTGVKQSLSDAWITTAAKMRLLANDKTPALQINVDTDHGIVTLFGVVPTADAKKVAEIETAKVSGVHSVINALQVVPEPAQKAVAATDEDVKKAIASALEGRDDLKNVNVEVKNGVARLTGTVPDSSDRLEASVVVRAARGVRSVQNDLRVAQVDDAKLRR